MLLAFSIFFLQEFYYLCIEMPKFFFYYTYETIYYPRQHHHDG